MQPLGYQQNFILRGKKRKKRINYPFHSNKIKRNPAKIKSTTRLLIMLKIRDSKLISIIRSIHLCQITVIQEGRAFYGVKIHGLCESESWKKKKLLGIMIQSLFIMNFSAATYILRGISRSARNIISPLSGSGSQKWIRTNHHH